MTQVLLRRARTQFDRPGAIASAATPSCCCCCSCCCLTTALSLPLVSGTIAVGVAKRHGRPTTAPALLVGLSPVVGIVVGTLSEARFYEAGLEGVGFYLGCLVTLAMAVSGFRQAGMHALKGVLCIVAIVAAAIGCLAGEVVVGWTLIDAGALGLYVVGAVAGATMATWLTWKIVKQRLSLSERQGPVVGEADLPAPPEAPEP